MKNLLTNNGSNPFEILIAKISKHIFTYQKSIANRLNKKVANLSKRQLLLFLSLFMFCAISYSALLFHQALTHKTKRDFPTLNHTIVPKSIALPDSLNLDLLRSFKAIRDSLKKDSTNTKK